MCGSGGIHYAASKQILQASADAQCTVCRDAESVMVQRIPKLSRGLDSGAERARGLMWYIARSCNEKLGLVNMDRMRVISSAPGTVTLLLPWQWLRFCSDHLH
jgi:hypothetical protein